MTVAIPIAGRLLLTIGLLAIGVIGTRILEARVESHVAETEHINQHQQSVTFRVLQLSVFTAVGLAALSLWNVNLGGLLVGAGFLGIVVRMAARQTLGSLVAGFVLMFSRPFEIGVDYETDIDRARKLTRETIADLERVRPSPRPQVVPTSFGDSAVVLEARFWIDQPNAFRKAQVTAEVVEAVKAAYDDAEITIPFPQRTVGRRAKSATDGLEAAVPGEE